MNTTYKIKFKSTDGSICNESFTDILLAKQRFKFLKFIDIKAKLEQQDEDKITELDNYHYWEE